MHFLQQLTYSYHGSVENCQCYGASPEVYQHLRYPKRVQTQIVSILFKHPSVCKLQDFDSQKIKAINIQLYRARVLIVEVSEFSTPHPLCCWITHQEISISILFVSIYTGYQLQLTFNQSDIKHFIDSPFFIFFLFLFVLNFSYFNSPNTSACSLRSSSLKWSWNILVPNP